MQKILKKIEQHSEDEIQNVNELKLKESQGFNDVQSASAQLEAQRLIVNKLVKETDVTMLKAKMTALRAKLRQSSKSSETLHVKEIDAKDQEEKLNVRVDNVESTESTAVQRLQSKMKRAKDKKDQIAARAAELAGVIAKASALKKSGEISYEKNKAEVKVLDEAAAKARAEAAKEGAAKQKEAGLKADEKHLSQKIDMLSSKISSSGHNVKAKRAQQTAAALAIDEAKAKKAAATDNKDNFDTLIENAKENNEQSVKAFQLADSTLVKSQKEVADATAKLNETKTQLVTLEGKSGERVDVVGPSEKYEVAHKTMKKYEQQVVHNSVKIEDASQELRRSKGRNEERLENIKQDQSSAVKMARGTRDDMAADKVKESAAKKAADHLSLTQESDTKKTQKEMSELRTFQDEVDKKTAPKLQAKLEAAKKKLSGLIEKVEDQKVHAAKLEHMTKSAIKRQNVAKLALQKAANAKKEVSREVAMQELDMKDDLKRKMSGIGLEKDGKTRAKTQAEHELKAKNGESSKLNAEKQTLHMQEAKAGAMAASLEAGAAHAKAASSRDDALLKLDTANLEHLLQKEHDAKETMESAQRVDNEAKGTMQKSLDTEHEAQKEARIAQSKANLATVSTKNAKEEQTTAEDKVNTRKEALKEAHKEMVTLSESMTAAKKELADNKVALEKAWTTPEKDKFTDATQASQAKVDKVTSDYDKLSKKIEVLDGGYDNAKIELTETEAALSKDKEKYGKVQAKEKVDVDRFAEEQKAAGDRAKKAARALRKVDMQVEAMKRQFKETKRRVAEAQKIMDAQKAKDKADCDKQNSLQAKALATETSASELKAANKVKLDADRTTMDAVMAGKAKKEEESAEEAERSGLSTLSKDQNAEAKAEAKVTALNDQLAQVKDASGKSSVEAFEAATGGTGGASIARQNSDMKLASQDLGDLQAETSKLTKGHKLTMVIQRLVKHKEIESKSTKEAAEKALKKSTSESAVKSRAQKLTDVKLVISQNKQKIDDLKSKLEDQRFTLQEAKMNFGSATAKAEIAKTHKSLEDQKLAQLRAQESQDRALADSSQGNTAVTATMNSVAVKAKIETVKEKIKQLADALDAAKSIADEQEKGVVEMQAKVDESHSGLQSFEALLNHASTKEGELGGWGNKTKAMKETLARQEKLAAMLSNKLRDTTQKADESEEQLDADTKQELQESLRIKDANEALQKTKALKKEKEAAAEKGNKDNEKAQQLEDEKVLEEQKLKREKMKVESDKGAVNGLKEIATKKEETAEALKSTALKASAKEKSAVEKSEAANDINKFNIKNNLALHGAVQEMMSKINIPELVKKSKAAMATALLGNDPSKPLRKTDKTDAQIAAATADKATKTGELVTMKGMKDGMKALESTKEIEEKSRKRTKEVSKKKKDTAEKERKNAIKAAEEGVAAAKMALKHVTTEVADAKYELTQTVNSKDPHPTVVMAGKTKVSLLEGRLAQKKEAFKEAKEARDDAQEAIDAAYKQTAEDADSSVEELKARSDKAVKAASKHVDKDVKHQEGLENKLPQKENLFSWQDHFNQVTGLVKAAAETPKDEKPPGKPKHVERAEKAAKVMKDTNHVITKFKKLNDESKKQKEAALNAPGAGDATENAANRLKAERLAKEAEEHSAVAAEAAKKVKGLEGELHAAKAASLDNAPELVQQLTTAKVKEEEARKAAEDAVEKAKEAGMKGGEEGQKAEEKSQAQAQIAKLKAEKESAEENLKVETAVAKESEAEAKAEEDMKKAAAVTDPAKKAQLTAEARSEKAEAVRQAAKAGADKPDPEAQAERSKAAAASGAAKKIDGPKSALDEIPEMKGITEKKVTEVTKQHIAELMTTSPARP